MQRKRSAAAGVARDSSGQYVGGFQVNLGFCSSLFAELWSIKHGLKWALSKEIQKLEVENDSQLAIYYATDPTRWNGRQHSLLWEIHNLMQHPWTVKLVHSIHETNFPAHWLAKDGLRGSPGEVVNILTPPSNLMRCLYIDSIELPHSFCQCNIWNMRSNDPVNMYIPYSINESHPLSTSETSLARLTSESV